MTAIAIALFEGAEELDFAGPWEVLASWATQHPDDGVSVFTVGDSTDLLQCAKGLKVAPDHTWDTAPAPDVLIVPGGSGVYAKLEDEAFLQRLRADAGRGTLVTSVCTGALALAAAGLLRDRPATTWWGRLDRLAELEPTARGPYCGSLGYIGFDGQMDTNILIRTFTIGRGWVQFPVGGGIVADSVPEREYEETWHKAEGLLRALR